ncbi:MAG TPA: hypothetical protein VEW46_17635 [Pyrinomonadaceae bacterium]|nr:hypothetical protein [Pyrinomonadaceae bacterium]
MNPHSLLSDEFFGVGFNTHRARREAEPGLRDRVTACRKRARLHRTMQKSTRVCNQSDEVFSEPDSAPSQPRQYTEEYSAVVAGRLVEEQEVGIT